MSYEAVCAVFAFGTLWYFLVSGLWIVAVFWCVEKESAWGSGIWTILYLIFMQLFVKVNMVEYSIKHPVNALLYVLGYIILGFGWSFIKWWLYVNKSADKYKEKRYEWLLKQKDIRVPKGQEIPEITIDTPVPDFLIEEWKRHAPICVNSTEVHENKGKISIWIIYWPVSMIWSVINDFIKKFIKTVIMKLRVVYDSITKLAFKNVEKLD